MTLYEIDKSITDLMESSVDPETGEIQDITDALDALTMEQGQKRENIALFIKDLSAEAAAIRNEEKALADRRRVTENKAERLKNYLMASLAGEKFSTPKVSVSYRNSTAVYIEDEAEFLREHPEYARIKTEIDRAGIKDALKKGEQLSGAALEERTSMIVR